MEDSSVEKNTNDEIIDSLIRKVNELEKLSKTVSNAEINFEGLNQWSTKFEECVNDFNSQNRQNIALNIKITQENINQSLELQKALKEVEVPKEIVTTARHTYEHKHFNAGVRFMLITLVGVILIASGISIYYYNKYNQLKGFEKDYDVYKQNNDWQIGFFTYMYKKHPNDSKKYIKNNPLPK
jgi:hypothetical protein